MLHQLLDPLLHDSPVTPLRFSKEVLMVVVTAMCKSIVQVYSGRRSVDCPLYARR